MADISRFLIIERDTKQADVYSGFIREIAAAQIDVVPSTDAAFEKLAASTYQLVVMDDASCKDSVGALERLKGVNPNTGIILIAQEASIEEAVKMVRLGAEDYFPKPVNPDSFKLAVRRCLDRRDLLSGDAQVVSFMNLINACQLISASLDEQRVFETIMGYLRRETGCRGMALYRYVGGARTRVPTSSDSDVDVIDVAVEWAGVLEKCVAENLSCKAVARSAVSPELLVFHFKWVAGKDYFAVCASPDGRQKTEEVFSRYKFLQVQAQLTGKNIGNYVSVRDLLYRDDATSLHNARYLSVSLDKAFEQQKRTQQSFAILFVDLDHFKSVNDGHGHLIGTKLLNEVGEILKKEVRPADTICRYGGDEFVVILQGAKLAEAKGIAERIRLRVEANQFLQAEGHNIRLTVSIGVAVCPDHAKSKTDIVAAADHAMYVAKKSSRNFVYVADGKGMPAKPSAPAKKAA